MIDWLINLTLGYWALATEPDDDDEAMSQW